jgi:glutathione S-transferase
MTIQLYELCAKDENVIFSPHCWKARMALAHKGLSFESIKVPFTKVAGVENGEGRTVPVLRDGDDVIQDSYNIALHLEGKYPDAPSLFNGDGGKSLTRFVINWSQTQIHPVVYRLVIMQIYNSLAPADQVHFRTTREARLNMTLEEFSATRGASATDLQNALVPLEEMLASQPFIGGNDPLFADYVVFGAIQWCRVFKGQSLMKKDSRAAVWFEQVAGLHNGAGNKLQFAA